MEFDVRVHSATLTSLNIVADDDFWDANGIFESFQSFHMLQHLHIPARAIFGPKTDSTSSPNPLGPLLPLTLIDLELRLGRSWDVRHFMDVTGCPYSWQTEKANFPNLKRFVLRRGFSDPWRRDASSDLIRAFRDVNIVVDPPLGTDLYLSLTEASLIHPFVVLPRLPLMW